jgi:hypothetical protein
MVLPRLFSHLIHKKQFRMNYVYFEKSNPPSEGEDLPHRDYQRNLTWEYENNIIILQPHFMHIKLK